MHEDAAVGLGEMMVTIPLAPASAKAVIASPPAP